jgi:hypothetical protein
MSHVIGNPLTNSSKGIGNFCKQHIFARELPILSNLWPEVFITLQSSCQSVLDNLYRHLQEGSLINKEIGNLYGIPLKKLKAKIKIQGTTHSFKQYKRFIF